MYALFTTSLYCLVCAVFSTHFHCLIFALFSNSINCIIRANFYASNLYYPVIICSLLVTIELCFYLFCCPSWALFSVCYFVQCGCSNLYLLDRPAWDLFTIRSIVHHWALFSICSFVQRGEFYSLFAPSSIMRSILYLFNCLAWALFSICSFVQRELYSLCSKFL